MLSTRQAHHVLKLAERHGAKVVFAGDTRQQQPVEAGPGLRLIRDAVGSFRVDRIRRQKADMEDILVHVHGETPQAARFRAGLMGDDERERILADYEAMEKKPSFTPWQVAASEALRDGEAAEAIKAYHARGRFAWRHGRAVDAFAAGRRETERRNDRVWLAGTAPWRPVIWWKRALMSRRSMASSGRLSQSPR